MCYTQSGPLRAEPGVWGGVHFEAHLPQTCSATVGKYVTILSLHLLYVK